MQVIVNGLLTGYERSGTGRIVLLLHGWGDTAAGLTVLAKPLANHYSVINLDLPGFGSTATPDGVWGLNEYASFVHSFVRKLDIEPYAIIGHSNGGAIAIRGLGTNTIQAGKLVLLASSGIRDAYQPRIKALRLITKTGKLLTKPLPPGIKKRLRTKVYSAVGSDMLVAENLQESFKKVVTDDVRVDAQHIHIPTLLIYGDSDTAAPPSYGEMFQKLIKGSQLHVLPQAGHFVHLDKSAEVANLVEEFLK
jgi:pimeloyl-ACP methyl ester carboxylesterase